MAEDNHDSSTNVTTNDLPVMNGGGDEPKSKDERSKRRRRTAKRAVDSAEGDKNASDQASGASSDLEDSGQPTLPLGDGETAPKATRRRGRPRKKATDVEPKTDGDQDDGRKSESDVRADDVDAMTKATQEHTKGSSEVMDAPAATLAEADAAGEGRRERQPRDNEQQERGSRRRRRRNGAQDNNGGGNGEGGGNGNQRQGRNQRRHNRKGNQRDRVNQREQSVEPSLTREKAAEMKVAELRKKAAELGIEYVGLRKKDLVEAVYDAAAEAEGFRPVEGVLDFQGEGRVYVRTGNYMSGDNDAFVQTQIIRRYGLRPGDWVKGTVAPSRSNGKYPPLHTVESVNGRDPEELKGRPRFRDLTPIYPNERLVMEHGKDSITGRAIDLVAPIGKGQRGLIVSPPKAGKTTVLKNICQSIAANNPEVHLFCLLVDERPEEVTDMERSIRGEVVASTFDMPASNHTAVAELVIEHAKRLVELGEDVVVVLDSITRLARAYNLAAPVSGRILSGGVDSAALYPPKKFLGAARNIEGGGSLTILASALVDTGSKMDEVIFEEFKGTGNMELKLDRELADRRIFPAIDPVASGTRNEELLIDPSLQPFIWGIRRLLANMNNTERAATVLVKGLKATNNNEEFLIRSAKKAQQTEYIGA